MRRELDYIGDDPAALRWALGCVLASYRTRLAHRPSVTARTAWHVAASGVMLLVIGLALQDNTAEGQTQPPPPAFDEAACDLAPELRHNGTASVPRKSDDPPADRFRSDCAGPASANIPDTARGR
jgi:hypothetical protein